MKGYTLILLILSSAGLSIFALGNDNDFIQVVCKQIDTLKTFIVHCFLQSFSLIYVDKLIREIP
jgi:hypothetical protein